MIAFYLDEDVTDRLADLLSAIGYDVTTTGRLGNKGQKDPQQLLTAANLNRVFVTYNAGDYEVLHEAWRVWPSAWSVTPEPRHFGILIIHPAKNVTPPDIANAIHRFAGNSEPIANRLFAWTIKDDWHEIL